VKKLFALILALMAFPAWATQETAAKSNPVVIASDQSSLWVQVGVPTQTPTFTYTSTFTYTPTGSATPTRTWTPTRTPTNTKTHTPTYTNTPTFTGTLSPTAWTSYTATPTYTSTPTLTNTPTFTNTPSFTPTGSNTPTYTSTNTYTSTLTFTATSTFTPWVPLVVAVNIQSVTPTPIHTPIAGVLMHLIVDSMGNAGTAGANFKLTRNDVVIKNVWIAPAGGLSNPFVFYDNGNSTWAVVPADTAGASFQLNYRLFRCGPSTPVPILR